LFLKLITKPLIIVVQKSHVPTSGLPNTRIASSRPSSPRAVSNVVNPWIVKTFDEFSRIIAAGVIHNQDLKILKALI
jgi:hypothetical protein